MKKIVFILLLPACVFALCNCKKNICGCTNSNSVNYNPEATQNDGSCDSVGRAYEGGILAYILQPGDPGYVSGQVHGLIVASSDQSTSASWGCEGTTVGSSSSAIGSGKANTTAILNGCPTSGIAARICTELTLNGYSDWYLPSTNELNAIYLSKGLIGQFANTDYWSSTENANSTANFQDFIDGHQGCTWKSSTAHVRAIRTF